MEHEIHVTASFKSLNLTPIEDDQSITVQLILPDDTDLGVIGRAKRHGEITVIFPDKKALSRTKVIPVTIGGISFNKNAKVSVTLRESDLGNMVVDSFWNRDIEFRAVVDPDLGLGKTQTEGDGPLFDKSKAKSEAEFDRELGEGND